MTARRFRPAGDLAINDWLVLPDMHVAAVTDIERDRNRQMNHIRVVEVWPGTTPARRMNIVRLDHETVEVIEP